MRRNQKHPRPRLSAPTVKVEVNPVPELRAADLLKAEHVYHPQFVRWLQGRGVELDKATKRQARKFLASNPVLRRAWSSVWKQHGRKEAA